MPVSCSGDPSALFRSPLEVAPSSSLSTRLREHCVYRAAPKEHTLLPCCPNVHGGADGITVIQAIGPFIKRQAVSIHLIAPGVWKCCHSSVDISSMRCLQAINVYFYKICLYYSVLISVLSETLPHCFLIHLASAFGRYKTLNRVPFLEQSKKTTIKSTAD